MNRKNIFTCLIICVSLLLLSGCSLFTYPIDQPVIEEKLNPRWLKPGTVGTLSLTPERRVVLVNFKNNRFCAEAPTETGLDANRLRRLKAAAEKSDIKADFESLSAASRNNTVLNSRSQGLQLFLASSYFVCQMFMNEAISRDELIEYQMELLSTVNPIISKEVDLMYEYAGENAAVYQATEIFGIAKEIANTKAEIKDE